MAAIKPHKLDEVHEALISIGAPGMMISEIKGFGKQSGHSEIYRGADYLVNFVTKTRVELVVEDNNADLIANTIQKAASTDEIGDGKIFILGVQEAIRIRTGETGQDAL
tara:strand:+ start:114 stop:440 length:327 start_codon:yes stop_codon:yes gene_type:complete